MGVETSKALSFSQGVVALQLNMDWLHEFKDDQRAITAQFAQDLRPNPVRFNFLNQAPDHNWYLMQVSLAAVFANGLNGFLSIEKSVGHDYIDQYSFSLGMRLEF